MGGCIHLRWLNNTLSGPRQSLTLMGPPTQLHDKRWRVLFVVRSFEEGAGHGIRIQCCPLSVGGKDLCVCVCHVCSNFYQRQSIHQTFSRLCDFCCVWKWRRQRKLLPDGTAFHCFGPVIDTITYRGLPFISVDHLAANWLAKWIFWGEGGGQQNIPSTAIYQKIGHLRRAVLALRRR